MFSSILVPLDGSPFSEEALPVALKIANLSGAGLEIMRVHEVYGIHDAYYSWSPYNTELDAMLKEREQAYLDAVACRLKNLAAGPVTSYLDVNLIEDGIVDRIRSKPADLIVMSTHGRGPVRRFWLGSVADRLMRHTQVPIVLVRPQGAPAHETPLPSMRRILVPVDGSALAETVLDAATALGGIMGAEFTLLRVVQGEIFPFGEPLPPKLDELARSQLASQVADAQAYLDKISERLLGKDSGGLGDTLVPQALSIDSRVVVEPSPATAILDMACKLNIDLIAIATHGVGGLKRLVLGSVTDKVVRGATTPVLVYRPLPVRRAAPGPAPKLEEGLPGNGNVKVIHSCI